MAENEKEKEISEECTHDCSSCSANCSSRDGGNTVVQIHESLNEFSRVKKVIGVVSGKGGVGKSIVTSLMSVMFSRKGYKTAILDADITGPSIPKAFGLNQRAMGSEKGIHPVTTEGGIEVMSINLLLENAEDPVVWRGPVLAGTVKQFWSDVVWGDIDFMFVDMPPGTGDVPLTVYQSLPIDGIIVVTSPQDLVSMIVGKAVKMAKLMNVPILGIIENMSYFACPDCGKKHYPFGESKIEEVAKRYDLEVIAQLPIDPKNARACDEGRIESIVSDEAKAAAEKLETLIH